MQAAQLVPFERRAMFLERTVAELSGQSGRIVTASADRTARIWDADSWSPDGLLCPGKAVYA